MLLQFENLAKNFGFLTETIEDSAQFIRQKVKEGKVVLKWDNETCSLHHCLDANSPRLLFWKKENLEIKPDMELKLLNKIWRAFDYFCRGEVDYFVCNKSCISFPEECRPLIQAIAQSSQEEKLPSNLADILKNTEQSKTLVTNVFLKNLYGKVLSLAKKHSEAGAAFREAAQMMPEFGEAYSNLGTLLWQLGKKREAFVLFSEALLKNPFSLSAQLNFFDAGYELQEFNSIKSVIEEVVKLDTGIVEFKHHLSICCYRVGDIKRAQEILVEILKDDPQDEEAERLLKSFGGEAIANNMSQH